MHVPGRDPVGRCVDNLVGHGVTGGRSLAFMVAVSTNMASITAPLLAALARWGYAGVALGVFLESAGVPVPGETALIAAAFGAAHGVLSLPWIIVVASAASILGDNLGFAVGRRLGRGWVEQHGHRVLLTPARLQRVDAFFERFGPMAVALARFVTGVRVVAALAAGTSRMPWPVFLRYNVLGAVAWAVLVSLFGYALGRGYAGAATGGGHAGAVLAVVIPVVLVAAWMLMRNRRGVAGQQTNGVVAWTSGTGVHAATPGLRSRLSQLTMRWMVVLSVSAAAVTTFAAIAEEVVEHDTAWFDNAVQMFVLSHQWHTLHVVFATFTWAGSSLVLGPVAAGMALWLWRRARRRAASVAPLAAATSMLAMLALKSIFHRVRPIGAPEYAHLGYSFPSGHSMNSMAIAVTLAYVLAREKLAPRWGIAVAVLFSLLVGMSRVYLDVHWATDVLGGWALGLAVAAGCSAFYEWMLSQANARETH